MQRDALYYKFTDQNSFTRKDEPGETHWEVGEVVYPTGEGNKPCGPGVLHFFHAPLMGALVYPLCSDEERPRMFIVEPLREVKEERLTFWTTGGVRVLREVPCPELTCVQRVEIAIRAVLELCEPPEKWQEWAGKWLSGEDRSGEPAGIASWEVAELYRWSAMWAAAAARDSVTGTTWGAAASAARAAVYTRAVADSSDELEKIEEICASVLGAER